MIRYRILCSDPVDYYKSVQKFIQRLRQREYPMKLILDSSRNIPQRAELLAKLSTSTNKSRNNPHPVLILDRNTVPTIPNPSKLFQIPLSLRSYYAYHTAFKNNNTITAYRNDANIGKMVTRSKFEYWVSFNQFFCWYLFFCGQKLYIIITTTEESNKTKSIWFIFKYNCE